MFLSHEGGCRITDRVAGEESAVDQFAGGVTWRGGLKCHDGVILLVRGLSEALLWGA